MQKKTPEEATPNRPQSWIEQSILDSLEEMRRLSTQWEQRIDRIEATVKEVKSTSDQDSRIMELEGQIQALQKDSKSFRTWATKVGAILKERSSQTQQIEARIMKLEGANTAALKALETTSNDFRKLLTEFRNWVDT